MKKKPEKVKTPPPTWLIYVASFIAGLGVALVVALLACVISKI
jgi:hypothetical protein